MSVPRTFSFRKGYRKLTLNDSAVVREELKESLGLNNNSFYRRLRGEVEPKITEVERIENIFSKYGVTDIWGD